MLAKVALDTLLWCPWVGVSKFDHSVECLCRAGADISVFPVVQGTLEGRKPAEIKRKVQMVSLSLCARRVMLTTR